MLLCCAGLSCSGGGPPATTAARPESALGPTSPGSLGRIELIQLDARPRLTLVTRDGDPAPAIVAVVATDLGPVATTALAALVETRMQAAGFDVDTRVDRSAFRARWLVTEPARVEGFFAALAGAFQRSVAPSGPELAVAAQRLDALRRNPLDAPELVPVAGCTGKLGIAGADPVIDVTSAAGVRELEGWRKATLHAGRTSLAAVGPRPFCAGVVTALTKIAGWEKGAGPTDPPPTGDSIGVYASASLERRGARAGVAVRVADARAAVAAAERLGAPGSPLLARLSAMQPPWRALEVIGVARPRGGCVSITLEASGLPTAPPVERSAALAVAVARQEVRIELGRPIDTSVASRQILGGTDPREAAARGAWWAMSAGAPGAPERWATVLALPPSAELRPGAVAADPTRQRFESELGRALAAGAAPVSEKRFAIEQGQGELWLLVASPCGVVEEGVEDAGGTALAAVAAVHGRREVPGISVEPWITQDGIGVLAHAPLRDASEPPVELARRVADAAARTLAAASISGDALAAARAATLSRLEVTGGRQATAMDAFASAIVPDHPSWVEPFGTWNRVASGGLESVRLRWQALAAGPVRLAVLANADRAQATVAGDAVDRWLGPAGGERACRNAAPGAGRPGRYEVRLPQGVPFGQSLIGAPVPPGGAAGHDLAELTAAALDGDGGLLAGALGGSLVAGASARIQGGSRAASLVIDVRAPPDALVTSVGAVKALLARLAQSGPTDADLARALGIVARRQRESRTDPRRRLIELWSGPGRGASSPGTPTTAAWRDWIAGALKDSSLVVVEALPE